MVPSTLVVIPVALDNTALNFCDDTKNVNFIRIYEFPKETFTERACLAIFHEIYRYGLNESRAILVRGKDSALKLFLSHAKDGTQGKEQSRQFVYDEKGRIVSYLLNDKVMWQDTYDPATGQITERDLPQQGAKVTFE